MHKKKMKININNLIKERRKEEGEVERRRKEKKQRRFSCDGMD